MCGGFGWSVVLVEFCERLTDFLKAPAIDAVDKKMAHMPECERQFVFNGAKIWRAKRLAVEVDDLSGDALNL